MSLTSSMHTGGVGGGAGAAGAARAPSLEGASDYAVWCVRIDAHLQARGAQDAHVRVLTEAEYRRRKAALDAWDAEDDERAFGGATGASSSTKKEAHAAAAAEAAALAHEQRKHARALMLRSDMAYGIMLAALPETLQQAAQHTIARGHAYGLWSWLEAKFQNTERDNVGALWRQWTALQQEADEPFDTYRTRVMSTLALLKRAKQHVSTEQLLFVLTDRLCAHFKAASLALKNGALIKDVKPAESTIKIYEAQYDFDAIAAFLNAHERAEMRADGATSEQMAAAAMGQRRTGNRHGDDNREPPWATEPCWTCGKVGHPARRCPKGSAKGAQGRDRGNRGGNGDDTNERKTAKERSDDDDDIAACCVLETELPESIGRDEQWHKMDRDERHVAFSAARQWAQAKLKYPQQSAAIPTREMAVTAPEAHTAAHASARKHELRQATGPPLAVDTMCSNHCTSDKELFTGPLRTVAPVRVKVANGQILEVTRVGSVSLRVHATKVGGSGRTHSKVLRITDMYYHPLFTTTLLSWGKLRELGWHLASGDDSSAMTAPGGWRMPLCNYGRLLMLATDKHEPMTSKHEPTTGKHEPAADKRVPTATPSSPRATHRAAAPVTQGSAAPAPRETQGAADTDADGWTRVEARRQRTAAAHGSPQAAPRKQDNERTKRSAQASAHQQRQWR